jgi:Fe2+ transport system protein B
MKKELGSWKLTFVYAVSVMAIAWVVAFFVYKIGLMLGLS